MAKVPNGASTFATRQERYGANTLHAEVERRWGCVTLHCRDASHLATALRTAAEVIRSQSDLAARVDKLVDKLEADGPALGDAYRVATLDLEWRLEAFADQLGELDLEALLTFSAVRERDRASRR